LKARDRIFRPFGGWLCVAHREADGRCREKGETKRNPPPHGPIVYSAMGVLHCCTLFQRFAGAGVVAPELVVDGGFAAGDDG
jgi:hypothetical protein